MTKLTLEKFKEEEERIDKFNNSIKNDIISKNKSRNELLKSVRERAISNYNSKRNYQINKVINKNEKIDKGFTKIEKNMQEYSKKIKKQDFDRFEKNRENLNRNVEDDD